MKKQPKRLEYVPFRKPDLYAAIKAYAAIEGYRMPEMGAILMEIGARKVGIYPIKGEVES
jgi:hypothetical protein